jgi:hypothetical protein
MAVVVIDRGAQSVLHASRWFRRYGQALSGAFEGGDAVRDRWVGVEEAVDTSFVMLEWIVDAHRRGRVVEFL